MNALLVCLGGGLALAVVWLLWPAPRNQCQTAGCEKRATSCVGGGEVRGDEEWEWFAYRCRDHPFEDGQYREWHFKRRLR